MYLLKRLQELRARVLIGDRELAELRGGAQGRVGADKNAKTGVEREERAAAGGQQQAAHRGHPAEQRDQERARAQRLLKEHRESD